MIALLTLIACGPRVPTAYDVSGEGPDWGDLRRQGVAVAPVVFVRDLPAPPLPEPPAPGRIEEGVQVEFLEEPTHLDPVRDAAFLRNDYVGNVRFGGGFVRTGDVALEVRARLIEFSAQDAYAELAGRWLADSVAAALSERDVPARPIDLRVVPPVEHVARRGLHPDDGRDDVNLPRTDLRPLPLPEDARAGAGAEPWVLVPYLRSYYTHNGGWFLGQQYGCMGGARIEATLVLYDVATGRPAWWMSALGRHLQPRRGQPSRAELDQYLLWAEDQVELAFREGLFR